MIEAWIIGLHLATVHVGDIGWDAHRAMYTPGIYAVDPAGMTMGVYRNSLSHTGVSQGNRYTIYAGWTWKTGLSIGPLRNISITTAGATGYLHPVSPLLGIGATLGQAQTAPRILWVPHKTQPISLAVERKF